MPITQDTITLTRGVRVAVDAQVDDATRVLTERWVLAWDELTAEWRAAVAAVIDQIEDGQWPSRGMIDRLSRVRQALGHTLDTLDQLADDSIVTIVDAAGATVDLTPEWQERIIGSQLPRDASQLGIVFDRTDPDALRAIVERITQQVTSVAWALSPAATEAMYRSLVRGVAAGQNPRTIARLMLARLESEFNGGLARAINIARTEILDAYREATRVCEQANADVIAGWVWICTFSTRTCPSCLSKHGTEYPITEAGPLDHQSGRCTRMTRTKTWRELGIDKPEPRSRALPDAREWFDALPLADQVAIMGRKRLEGLLAGEIEWDDLSTLRTTAGWRDSYGVTPLSDLLPA